MCLGIVHGTCRRVCVPPVLEKLVAGLDGETADLCVLFSWMHHADELGRISAALLEQGQAQPRHGLHRGISGRRGSRAGRLTRSGPLGLMRPGISLMPLRLDQADDARLNAIEGLKASEKSALLLLGDPFSFRVEDMLTAV